MTSNNDVSSQIPALSRLDRLEKIAGRFGGAVQEAGLWQKTIRKTATSFLDKLAASAESMEQLSRICKDAGKPAPPVNPGNIMPGTADGSTSRSRMREYSSLAGKMLFQFPEILPDGNKQRATGYVPAPDLKKNGSLTAASVEPVEQAAAMYGKPAARLKSESVNLFRSWLINPENETTGRAVFKNSIEKMIDLSPKIVKNSGYLNLIADRIDTTKSKITGFQGKGIPKLQQLAEVPVEKKITKNQMLTEQLHPEKQMELYGERIQKKNSAQQLHNESSNTNVDDMLKYQSGKTAAGNSFTQMITAMENAAESISASGRQVKNYNITINDGLIRQVDNHFNGTNESPESASDFMEKLSGALQQILSDVNYATV
ncbi:MAG: hypothetical protein LBR52_04745 [Prevotellaceae bacterium]|jgi:hypothetical protein|nr:hypothetical protein [Prevotellaceae bacterium]